MQWIRDRLHREDGVTVVELMVTAAVMAIVAAAVMSVWLRGQTESDTIYARRNDLNATRLAMQLMTKDLRQAGAVHTDTASTIDVETYVNGVKHRVAYTASGTTLTRSVDGVAAQQLLSNLANTNLFTYSFVGTTLHQITILLTVNTSSQEGTLNLQSEVETRNL